MLRNIRLGHLSVCWSVGLSVRKVYCGKTADWIQMLFGVVSRVSRRIGVLDGVVIVEGEGAVLGMYLGHLIASNGAFVAYLCGSACSD